VRQYDIISAALEHETEAWAARTNLLEIASTVDLTVKEFDAVADLKPGESLTVIHEGEEFRILRVQDVPT
jgi:hypothetical protein